MVTYRIPDGVLRAELDGDEVLLNPSTGVYHLLNPTGKQMLDILEAGSSLEDGAQQLAERCGMPVTEVLADGGSFVQAMLDRQLLEPVP